MTTNGRLKNAPEVSKLITFTLNWKHDDYDPWFSVIIEGKLTAKKKKKLFDFIKSEFDKEELTYVETGNLYVYNEVKYNDLCDILNGTNTEYESNDLEDNTVAKEDKGSYLFPVDYRMVVTDLSSIIKI